MALAVLKARIEPVAGLALTTSTPYVVSAAVDNAACPVEAVSLSAINVATDASAVDLAELAVVKAVSAAVSNTYIAANSAVCSVTAALMLLTTVC